MSEPVFFCFKLYALTAKIFVVKSYLSINSLSLKMDIERINLSSGNVFAHSCAGLTRDLDVRRGELQIADSR